MIINKTPVAMLRLMIRKVRQRLHGLRIWLCMPGVAVELEILAFMHPALDCKISHFWDEHWDDK